ncbi:MAG: ABC transporter ATP-binding protein [Hyphomicrobiales bacterium]
MSALEIEIAAKRFVSPSGVSATPVLNDVRFSVDAGQFACILGPSGCGKTTLLRLVSGLDTEFEGRIALPTGPNGAALKLAYVFQEPVLLPWRTVLDNLRLVMTQDQIERGLAERMLDAVGLGAEHDTFPRALSLGMSRRVSLARAFSVEPDLLLMDEPFVSLDEAKAETLRDLLGELWAEKPTTVLFVTHDSREAVRLAQRIVVLSGSPATVARDMAVDLGTEERHSQAAIERVRDDLLGPTPQP